MGYNYWGGASWAVVKNTSAMIRPRQDDGSVRNAGTFPNPGPQILSPLLAHGCSSARNYYSGYNTYNSTFILSRDRFPFHTFIQVRIACSGRLVQCLSSSINVYFLCDET